MSLKISFLGDLF